MICLLKRIRTGDEGTFGTLLLKDGGRELVLHTGELPWRENAVGKSCIPAGEYDVEMSFSNRFQRDLYEVKGVPGRSKIRIHHGNFCGDKAKGKHSDVEGCILVGLGHGMLEGQRAVVQSRSGLAKLHEFTGGAPLRLTVLDG